MIFTHQKSSFVKACCPIKKFFFFLVLNLQGIEASEKFEMGIEVETHGIKIQHPNEDEILVILQSSDGKWQLTSDTHDERIDKTNWVNLECRTVGGLNAEELRKYTLLTYKFMNEIKCTCDSFTNGQWELDAIKAYNIWQGTVQWMLPFKTIVFATKKWDEKTEHHKVLDFNLRPQLSFSFPLKHMRKVFLQILGQKQNKEYVMPDCLDTETKQEKEEWKNKSLLEIESANIIFGKKMLCHKTRMHNLYVQTDVIQYLMGLEAFLPEHGLFLLFCTHAYDIFFHNLKHEAFKETGPKGFMKVISRLPFSTMFNQLNESGQTAFSDMFQKHFSAHLSLKVKPYRRDDPAACYEKQSKTKTREFVDDTERFTLEKWFDSIIKPINREGEIFRDLMSPPPYVSKHYSMGGLQPPDINHLHAVVEARGYSQMISSETKKILDKFVTLVLSEAGIFFEE